MTVPNELLLDTYNPANREFTQSVNHIKNLLVTKERQCRHRHTQVAKDHFNGLSNADNAKKNKVSTPTVYSILKRPEIIELVDLLRHYSGLWDGPNIQERKRILWEIAADNKELDPRVAMQALDQLNKLEGSYQQEKVDPVISITINQSEKGALDVG